MCGICKGKLQNNYPVDGCRKIRLFFIKSEKAAGNHNAAARFWLLNPKGISTKTFNEA